MTAPMTVAVLGYWHVHAPDLAAEVVRNPGTTLVAVWDPDTALGTAGADEFGVEFVTDLDELLARDDIDAVIVTTSTDIHREVMTKAAASGKHILTEKLLAPTVAEAQDILDAVAASGVQLEVALPRLYEPSTHRVLELLRAGKLGTLTYARVRLAHDGSLDDWLPERFYDADQAIGGALSDLGCHAIYLLQLFLGANPETVGATYTTVTGRAVEDNAVVTLGYGSGAIGVGESSFVTVPGAFAFELRGTEGSVLFGFGGERMLAKGPHFDPESWTELHLDGPQQTPFDRWLDAIATGIPDSDNHSAALELTRLVVAANQSAASGSIVRY